MPPQRDLSVPMAKSDSYQMCLFAHMEIMCNLLMSLAPINSRRYHALEKIKAQFDPIDNTYRGYLPDHWIETSKEFELKMQEQLAELYSKFDPPVVEPQAPQTPKGKSKKKVQEGSMEKQLETINALMDSFKVDAAKAAAGNKAAGVRARKVSLALAKELKTFRALSTAA